MKAKEDPENRELSGISGISLTKLYANTRRFRVKEAGIPDNKRSGHHKLPKKGA